MFQLFDLIRLFNIYILNKIVMFLVYILIIWFLYKLCFFFT
jgi:hypothetical protein